jgi:hypothetical protein
MVLKRVCTFTQTYSNNRQELYNYHNLDKNDIKFRNLVDKNFYVFHNSPEEYISEILDYPYFKSIKNLEIIKYRDLSYTETLKRTFKQIQEEGFDYVVFLQDDVFTNIDSKMNIEQFIHFIKTADQFQMLNIEKSLSDLLIVDHPMYYQNYDVRIYTTNSSDFQRIGLWPFDDGPYIAQIDFIFDLYDNDFFSTGSVWDAEGYICKKVGEKRIPRFTCNHALYCRYDLIGKNIWPRKRMESLANLEKLKEITER